MLNDGEQQACAISAAQLLQQQGLRLKPLTEAAVMEVLDVAA